MDFLGLKYLLRTEKKGDHFCDLKIKAQSIDLHCLMKANCMLLKFVELYTPF